jgi:hypothetical protein
VQWLLSFLSPEDCVRLQCVCQQWKSCILFKLNKITILNRRIGYSNFKDPIFKVWVLKNNVKLIEKIIENCKFCDILDFEIHRQSDLNIFINFVNHYKHHVKRLQIVNIIW